jgi:hypothetical protein
MLLNLLALPFFALTAALPLAPQDGIRDDAQVLTAEVRSQVSAEMQGFTERTGIRLFIDTNTYIESSTASDRARALTRAWAGDEPAALMCVDRSSPQPPSVHVSDVMWRDYTEPELMASLRRTLEGMEGGKVNEANVVRGVRQLMKELEALRVIAQQRQRWISGKDWVLLIGFTALLAGIGTLGYFLTKRLRQREQSEAVQHFFPDVVVEQRLGASSGGGVLVELDYAEPEANSDSFMENSTLQKAEGQA